MKKILLVSMLFSATSLAQTAISVGQKAPEDGVFLTKEEAAKMIADKESLIEKHQLELETQKNKLETKAESDLKIAELKLDIEKEKNIAIINLKQKQIDNLYKELENDWEISGIWWLGGGILIGTVGSIAIFFAATQIQQTPSLLVGQ